MDDLHYGEGEDWDDWREEQDKQAQIDYDWEHRYDDDRYLFDDRDCDYYPYERDDDYYESFDHLAMIEDRSREAFLHEPHELMRNRDAFCPVSLHEQYYTAAFSRN